MPKQKFRHGVGAVPGAPGRWDINFQVSGKRVTERISASSFEEALALRLERKKMLRAHKESVVRGDPVFSLEEVSQKFKSQIHDDFKAGSKTKKTVYGLFERFDRFFFAFPKATGRIWRTTGDFSAKDLVEYKTFYAVTLGRSRGLSSEIRTVKTVLGHLYDMGFISSAKLFELRQVKAPKKNHVPFVGNPNEDFIKVFGVLKENYPRLSDFLLFLTMTGRRPEEVRSMKRQFVDMKSLYIFSEQQITKGDVEARLSINEPTLKKVVQRALDFSRKMNSEFLFLNDYGRKFSSSNPLVRIKKSAEACGIPNWQAWTVYQLKKRFVTACRSANLPSEKISLVSGHKDLESVLKHYSFPDIKQSGEVYNAARLDLK